MTLIPVVVAVLVLGISPVGVWLSDWLSPRLGLASPTVLGLLYAFLISGGTAAMRALQRVLPADPYPNEDSPWAIGDGRGQSLFKPLVVATVAAAILVAFMTPSSLSHILLLVGAMAVAFVPSALKPSKWPPRLQKYRTPDKVRTNDSVGGSPDADRVPISYTWSFDDLISTEHGSGRSTKHSACVQIRRSVYEDFRNRPHPHWREHPDQHGVLAYYVREGDVVELQDCAASLADKAAKLDLPYLDFVRFVLAFTADGVATERVDRSVTDTRFVKYPVETLFEKRGSVLDRSVLVASLLQQLGVKTLLIIAEPSDGEITVGLGIESNIARNDWLVSTFDFEGAKYFYCDLRAGGSWGFRACDSVKSAKAIIPLVPGDSQRDFVPRQRWANKS